MTQPTPVQSFDTDMAAISRARHTAKAYQRKDISEAHILDLLDILRFSSSSVNSQPWHFIVATTQSGRNRIAEAGMSGDYAFNGDAVRDAGFVAVFAARQEADEAYLEALLKQEDHEGRFPEPSNKEEMRHIRSLFVDLNRSNMDPGASEWMARQVYWNGGQFLHGAAAMGLDATPMEGIDRAGLDAAFDLPAKGYRALFVITVGHNADDEDWNYALPKSRLPMNEIVMRL